MITSSPGRSRRSSSCGEVNARQRQQVRRRAGVGQVRLAQPERAGERATRTCATLSPAAMRISSAASTSADPVVLVEHRAGGQDRRDAGDELVGGDAPGGTCAPAPGETPCSPSCPRPRVACPHGLVISVAWRRIAASSGQLPVADRGGERVDGLGALVLGGRVSSSTRSCRRSTVTTGATSGGGVNARSTPSRPRCPARSSRDVGVLEAERQLGGDAVGRAQQRGAGHVDVVPRGRQQVRAAPGRVPAEQQPRRAQRVHADVEQRAPAEVGGDGCRRWTAGMPNEP